MHLDNKMLVTGVQVNYFVICPTKLWFFTHLITQEKESEDVKIGSILDKISYLNLRKDILVDNKISLDFVQRKKEFILIHDIKKSPKLEKAHIYQMLYYLFYLKNIKGIKNVVGEINYPTLKKKVKVLLTPEKESEIKKILAEIKEITSLPKPPKPLYKKYCRKCSYFELCFC